MNNILDYLENSAEKYPDKTAFADEHGSCTYRELLDKAKRSGSALAQRFLRRSPVAVLADKSTDVIIAFMGIVYAGCFYVMLDPSQPEARLNQILDTLRPEALLIGGGYEKTADSLAYEGPLLPLRLWEQAEEEEAALEEIRRQALDTDPLYGIFTSGSTGRPKGVVVSHRSVIDFMEYFTELFSITAQDVIGNQAPFDFDVSVKDIYATIKAGATMEILPKQLFSFPAKLLDYLCERRVTTAIWAVSALCIISTLNGFSYRVPTHLNKILFSGEVMPVSHLNIWREHLPDALFVNLYGPTEITCNCTYYIVDKTFAPGETLPIGIPFPNESVFLLDTEDRPVTKPGMSGELCVAGTALSLGYYRDPEKTAAAFVQNPLNDRYPETVYRTGDLAHYGEDGLLYFESRRDFQIKHMGHRIELGEIEAALDACAGVVRACCIYLEEKNKIAAFYEGSADKKEITGQLGRRIPRYMFPNIYRNMPALPMTKNGKIDRQLLRRSL